MQAILVLLMWQNAHHVSSSQWFQEINIPWIPSIGTSFHFAIDGISLTLLTLTVFLGILAVGCSWEDIIERVGFFHCNLLWVVATISAVFMAIDLFLFYVAWELMLIPTYFLISLWGYERRQYAALKFFLFTQFGGLFLLISILALYTIHGQQTGLYTFDYQALLSTFLTPKAAAWVMAGFIIAFFVKLPVIPFHTWLPDAHTQAPTAGSLDLAGLLIKTGAYGLIRFVLPLFPEASHSFAPIAWGLGIIGIVYGAAMAFVQTDLKRLIAYTSISHMGFVLIGIFSFSPLALQGAMMIMIAHGISTGALFIMTGDVHRRVHTRDLTQMGGLWDQLPILGSITLFFAVASLGLPGLGNFVGEFLVLLGIYHTSIPTAVLASSGFIVSVLYALWIMQQIFYGHPFNREPQTTLSPREMSIYGCSMLAIVWLGLYPAPIFDVLAPAINRLVSVHG